MKTRLAPTSLALSFALVATPAVAGRSFDEPPGLGKVARAVPRASADQALTAAKLKERCADALLAPGMLGAMCRLAVAQGRVQAKPVSTSAEMTATVALAADALAAAQSLATFQPLSPEMGFGRLRFEAHRQACLAAMGSYDALRAASGVAAIATKVKGALKEYRPGAGDLKNAACGCVRDSLGLAAGADLTQDERGALQSTLTSHTCFLDESKLEGKLDPSAALQGSADAAAITAQVSDEGAMAAFAESRAIELDRCLAKEGPKLEKCACDTIAKWKLPLSKGAKGGAAKLPIEGPGSKRFVSVTVDASGKATQCGPIVGP